MPIPWIQRVFSPHCWLCTHMRDTDASGYFCSACLAALPTIAHACTHCGIPLTFSLAIHCANCQKQMPTFARCVCLWAFNNEIAAMIYAFKYHQRLDFGKAMSWELYKHVYKEYADQTLPDLLLAVPLHPKRLGERGFNQAQEIATILSCKLHIPYARHALQRQRYTQSQQQLNAKQRKKNLTHAFSIADNYKQLLHGKYLALIDDVVTTTSTIEILSRLLKECGARRIDVWALARVSKM